MRSRISRAAALVNVIATSCPMVSATRAVGVGRVEVGEETLREHKCLAAAGSGRSAIETSRVSRARVECSSGATSALGWRSLVMVVLLLRRLPDFFERRAPG